jgi:riboflavin synthase
MFTGIVEEIGRLRAAQPGKLTVSASRVVNGTRVGDSLAVNGVCLTVTDLIDSGFSVDVMPETLRHTNLGMLHPGDRVNLERALSLSGERLGGHLVQGHADGIGKALSMVAEGEALLVRYNAPAEVMRYVVERGFIAVDGVSLTVVTYNATSFVVSLVAYTRHHTTLGSKRVGDIVNLETDIVAKYVEHLKERDSSGITVGLLAEQGFLSNR